MLASKGGDPKAPAWLHDLRANPDVEVQVGRERQWATARVVAPRDPDRPIPVVAITPG